MDPDLRLAAMDEAGIEIQVVSPNPLTFFSHVEAQWADAFCRRHNDEVAALVARAPTGSGASRSCPCRTRPSPSRSCAGRSPTWGCSLPTSAPTSVVRSTTRRSTRCGPTCVELDVPVFFHPAPDGIDRPRRDERLARFDGDLWIGFCYEETLAVASLVLGGVLDRFPALDVCISHGGGATAWLAERMEHAARTRPWGPPELADAGAVAERLRRIWWDAHVGGPTALAALLGAFGPDRVVAGTNLGGWDQSRDPTYGDAALDRTFDGNARRLLRLDRGPGRPTSPHGSARPVRRRRPRTARTPDR